MKSTPIMYIALISLLLLEACSNGDLKDDPDYQPTTIQMQIVNIQDPYRGLPGYKFTASAKEIKALISGYGISNPEAYIKNTISYHRLEYTTTYKGNQIKVSGAIIIPIHPASKPSIVSFQHGTMFADRDAPSNATSVNDLFPLFNDDIVFLPDYIGYGSSKGIRHPYFIYEPIVTTVIDMIKAGKKYLDENQIPYDNSKLFLTGHSEGGYVTVAVQKELETNPIDGLKITASAPCAGPYDVGLIAKLLLQDALYPSPSYLLLTFSAYNNYYLQRPFTDFFQQPYASNADNYLNGNYNENEVNYQLTTNLSALLNPTFLNDFKNDGEQPLKNIFRTNSVNNWTPKTPTRLYHGTADNLVPYEISNDTYETFIANGANPNVVKLVPMPGVGHDYLPAYYQIQPWFTSLK